MKVRKIPERTCVVTREKYPKMELLTGKKNGRGAYIKKDLNVLELAKKNKALEKHLETKIEDNVYEEIKEIINK